MTRKIPTLTQVEVELAREVLTALREGKFKPYEHHKDDWRANAQKKNGTYKPIITYKSFWIFADGTFDGEYIYGRTERKIMGQERGVRIHRETGKISFYGHPYPSFTIVKTVPTKKEALELAGKLGWTDVKTVKEFLHKIGLTWNPGGLKLQLFCDQTCKEFWTWQLGRHEVRTSPKGYCTQEELDSVAV